jgi:hypothetical protein
MYQVFWNSQKLSVSTANKIQAIQIAREWIEAMENIRNTNWILLWADSRNCWNVLNYNNDCVWDNWNTYDIRNWMYKIYTDSNWKWKLEAQSSSLTSWDYKNSDYKRFFRVNLDANWLYTQTWWTNFTPLYTREINISYNDTNWDWTPNSQDESMNIKSIVMWQDSHGKEPHIVELDTVLTNWKK